MKQNTGTIPIETRRLMLRRFTPCDCKNVHKNWTSDPQVTRFLTWRAFHEEYETALLLDDWCQAYRHKDFYRWAIELKSLGEPIGTISMMRTMNPFTFETGYCLGKKWWGEGYAAEALQAVTAYMFASTPCKKILAKHALENPSSGRVLEKSGFVPARQDPVRAFTENGLFYCRLYKKEAE